MKIGWILMIDLPWQQQPIILHSQLILSNFQHWLGYSLLDINGSPLEISQALFTAPFVVATHDTQENPILNYGNQKALDLWEMSWQEFTQTPSRKTAETTEREARNHLLREAANQGFTYFSVLRITRTGKRFQIKDGIIWNLIDEKNQYCGQAAMFSEYEFL